MEYRVLCEDLTEFPAWSGGLVTLRALRKSPDAMELVQSYLDVASDGYSDIWTVTDVNDFLWFSADEYLGELGFRYDAKTNSYVRDAASQS